MTNKQVIPDCQQGNQGLSPQDVVREVVGKAIRDTADCPMAGSPIGLNERIFCDDPRAFTPEDSCACKLSADAAIAAVYDALLEMELPRQVVADAKRATFDALGSDEVRTVFAATIRSLANQGGE